MASMGLKTRGLLLEINPYDCLLQKIHSHDGSLLADWEIPCQPKLSGLQHNQPIPLSYSSYESGTLTGTAHAYS